MHMAQHVLLLDISPILLLCGLTKVLLRPVTRHTYALERRAGPLAHPAFAVALYVGVMWLWHVPALYDAALQHDTVHVLEHVCFFDRGLPVLVAPALPRAHADGPARHVPGRLHALDEGPRRPAGHRPDLRPGRALRLLPRPRVDLGPHAHRGPGGRGRDHGPRAVDHHGHRAGRGCSCGRWARASARRSAPTASRTSRPSAPPRRADGCDRLSRGRRASGRRSARAPKGRS